MSFIRGFFFGAALGIAAGTMISEQQRRNAAERVATTRERWKAARDSTTRDATLLRDPETVVDDVVAAAPGEQLVAGVAPDA